MRVGRFAARDVVLGGFVACCAAALTWPGYDWFGNRVEPLVFGLPFSFAWVVAWVVLSFVFLAGYHLSRGGDRRPDTDGPDA